MLCFSQFPAKKLICFIEKVGLYDDGHYTSMDNTMILGVPILPVPTLIELMSSLRSNYALYSDTMPLLTLCMC